MAGFGKLASARRGRARAAVTAAVLHGLALLALGWSVDPRTRSSSPVDQPTIEISVVRLAGPAPALRQAISPARLPRPAHPEPPAPARLPLGLPSPAPLAIPSPPSAAAREKAASLPPASGDLRGFLRATVGCDHADDMRLTAAERARCDAGYGVAAHTGDRLDMIPPEKGAAFSRQALADERKRTQREAALPGSPVVACTGAGSNFGLGCLPPDAIHGFKP